MIKHTKKVSVTDENSSPEARAERLRRVRNIANLSRKDMCNDGTINIHTYKGWEAGYFGGLPQDGADKVIKRIAKEGVICTSDWLIHGVGEFPRIVANFSQIKSIELSDNEFFKLDNLEQEKVILEELLLFRKNFKNIIYSVVKDDGMSPFYNIGEYVAGILRSGEKIYDLIGLDCIVQTEDGQILLRTLRQGNQKGFYMLSCKNTQTTVREPVIYNVKLLSAAPVIRHLRIDP